MSPGWLHLIGPPSSTWPTEISVGPSSPLFGWGGWVLLLVLSVWLASKEVEEDVGFRLMTSSRWFGDSAISGTTRQQSKSLVRTWFIWKRQTHQVKSLFFPTRRCNHQCFDHFSSYVPEVFDHTLGGHPSPLDLLVGCCWHKHHDPTNRRTHWSQSPPGLKLSLGSTTNARTHFQELISNQIKWQYDFLQ